MNQLLVSPTEWKDNLGDFMDLDTCALNAVESSTETDETPTVNVVYGQDTTGTNAVTLVVN